MEAIRCQGDKTFFSRQNNKLDRFLTKSEPTHKWYSKHLIRLGPISQSFVPDRLFQPSLMFVGKVRSPLHIKCCEYGPWHPTLGVITYIYSLGANTLA
jgi:hypothetical protein